MHKFDVVYCKLYNILCQSMSVILTYHEHTKYVPVSMHLLVVNITGRVRACSKVAQSAMMCKLMAVNHESAQ